MYEQKIQILGYTVVESALCCLSVDRRRIETRIMMDSSFVQEAKVYYLFRLIETQTKSALIEGV